MLMIRFLISVITLVSLVAGLWLTPFAQAQPLEACATVPDLGSLVQEIGGEQTTLTVFAKGTENAHFVVPKPSFIKALSTCDVYVQVGLDLEIGWAPPLLQNARNGAILPGGQGHIDASTAIAPLEIPSAPVDRSMGDVHPFGNPHYLLDPMNGLRVARLLRDRLSALRPTNAPYFAERYADFRRRLGVALVGQALADAYDFEKLTVLARHGRLDSFLKSQGQEALLGGWLGSLRPHAGNKLVGDHNAWVYFAGLFGFDMVAYLEPLPGILPTTKHMGVVIELMKTNRVKAVLNAAYYDPRYAQFVSENSGATIVPMAEQVASRPGTAHYLDMVDYNVKQLAAALAGITD